MTYDPVNNPGIPPIQPTKPGSTPESPGMLSGEGTPAFQLPKGKSSPSPQAEKPTPMDVARDAERQANAPRWSVNEMQDNLTSLQTLLNRAKTNLTNPNTQKILTEDHRTALVRLTSKLNPDLEEIAQLTEGNYQPKGAPAAKDSNSVLNYVAEWLGGGQKTLGEALNFASDVHNPDPVAYLKLQFAVQRATQKGELFASILGSTVSGIKTLLSTQLG